MSRSAVPDMIADGEVCSDCFTFIGGTPAGRPQLCETCERKRARTREAQQGKLFPARRGRLGNRKDV